MISVGQEGFSDGLDTLFNMLNSDCRRRNFAGNNGRINNDRTFPDR